MSGGESTGASTPSKVDAHLRRRRDPSSSSSSPPSSAAAFSRLCSPSSSRRRVLSVSRRRRRRPSPSPSPPRRVVVVRNLVKVAVAAVACLLLSLLSSAAVMCCGCHAASVSAPFSVGASPSPGRHPGDDDDDPHRFPGTPAVDVGVRLRSFHPPADADADAAAVDGGSGETTGDDGNSTVAAQARRPRDLPSWSRRLKVTNDTCLMTQSGQYLLVYADGRVKGTNDLAVAWERCRMEITTKPSGLMVFKGLRSDRFLCMNRKGKLFGSRNVNRLGCEFSETMTNSYFSSFYSQDRKRFMALSSVGPSTVGHVVADADAMFIIIKAPRALEKIFAPENRGVLDRERRRGRFLRQCRRLSRQLRRNDRNGRNPPPSPSPSAAAASVQERRLPGYCPSLLRASNDGDGAAAAPNRSRPPPSATARTSEPGRDRRRNKGGGRRTENGDAEGRPPSRTKSVSGDSGDAGDGRARRRDPARQHRHRKNKNRRKNKKKKEKLKQVGSNDGVPAVGDETNRDAAAAAPAVTDSSGDGTVAKKKKKKGRRRNGRNGKKNKMAATANTVDAVPGTKAAGAGESHPLRRKPRSPFRTSSRTAVGGDDRRQSESSLMEG